VRDKVNLDMGRLALRPSKTRFVRHG